jgi:hypothetical protein
MRSQAVNLSLMVLTDPSAMAEEGVAVVDIAREHQLCHNGRFHSRLLAHSLPGAVRRGSGRRMSTWKLVEAEAIATEAGKTKYTP